MFIKCHYSLRYSQYSVAIEYLWVLSVTFVRRCLLSDFFFQRWRAAQYKFDNNKKGGRYLFLTCSLSPKLGVFSGDIYRQKGSVMFMQNAYAMLLIVLLTAVGITTSMNNEQQGPDFTLPTVTTTTTTTTATTKTTFVLSAAASACPSHSQLVTTKAECQTAARPVT